MHAKFPERCDPESRSVAEPVNQAKAPVAATGAGPDSTQVTEQRTRIDLRRIARHAALGFRVEVAAGPHAGLRLEFHGPATLLVGRGDDAGLQLIDDPYFSRHHFELEFDPPCCRLRDLGSINGTLLNGRRVMDCFLRDGDEITGGQTRIRVSEVGSVVPEGGDEEVLTPKIGVADQMTTGPIEPITDPGARPLLNPPGYEILQVIGEGGMGSVCLARRRSDCREFALKLILPNAALGAAALTFFLREVSVLSRLDHSRIVKFHEIGHVQGQFYFVMDYIPALDLRSLRASLADSEQVVFACSVIADALEGLGYAHDLGIVHRDFKPSNLLVKWEDGLPAVKIADFGLAKSFSSAGFSGITPEARVLGTLPYLAPEQAQDARFVLPAADLYSAGATLYYLLAGQPPYQFSATVSALAMIAGNDPIPLIQHRPDLPQGLTEIVQRALARRPEDRFPSAAAMRLALLPFAEPRVPRTLPPGVRLRSFEPT
jgi:serine/threonine-protein kinase